MDTSSRILGIDYGSERIGLALSDPMRVIATPFKTLLNRPGVLDELAEIVRSEQVAMIVAGMPLNLKGEHAQKAQETEAFLRTLEERVGMSIVRLDERFTTKIAKGTLVALGTTKRSRREDRGRVDAMAAALLLQGYLDGARPAGSA
jgi:putative Holliday junction resolvase